MKLPEVTLGGVQDDVSPALERAAAGARQLGSVIEQGLTQYGQEVVKTQTMDAHLAASQKLNALDDELRFKKAFTTDELKARLGPAYDALPDAVKNQPPQPLVDQAGNPVRDAVTGEVATRPGDVPTHYVADAIYKQEAQKILEDASQHITVGGGWQSQFQRAAAADVAQRWNRLNDQMLGEAHQYQIDAVHRQVLTAAASGDFDTAQVRIATAGSVLGQRGQLDLAMQVAMMRQSKPIYDALLAFRADPMKPGTREGLERASRDLADQTKTGLIPGEHRTQLERQVEASLREHPDAPEKRTAATLALEAANGARDPGNPDRIDPVAALRSLDAHFQPGGKYADRPELYDEAASKLNASVERHNASIKFSQDRTAATAMTQFLGMDAQNQPHMSMQNIQPQVMTDLRAQGKEGTDVIARLVEMEKREQSRLRQDAQLPTSAESARAFLIERSMALRPGEWRGMSGADQLKVLLGLQGVPGEPDAPAVQVSSRDYPQLATKVAGLTSPVKPVTLTSPERIAFEEAGEAFKSAFDLKNPQRSPEDVRQGVRLLKDKLAAFIDDGVNRDGKGPTEAAVRAEAKRLLQTVEIRKSFLGIPYTRTVPRVQAEAAGQRFEEPLRAPPAAANPAPAAAAPVAPKGTPAGWVPYRNAKTGEVRFNAPGKAKGDWKEDR